MATGPWLAWSLWMGVGCLLTSDEICAQPGVHCDGTGDSGQDEGDADTDADTDADSDADADADSDADTDADSDQDGDGYTSEEGDCDDDDDAVNPSAEERCNNGKDDDCDGSPGDCGLGSGSLGDADAAWIGAGRSAAGVFVAAGPNGDADVSGDGLADVLVGASGWSGNTGGACLVSGAPASGALTSVGTCLAGEGANDYAGIVGAIVGDMDGDGLAEVAIGAPLAQSRGYGAAYVVLGDTAVATSSLADADLVLEGDADAGEFGYAAAAGDVDGDGLADLLVGYAGGARLYHGDATLHAVEAGALSLPGTAAGVVAGRATATAGDVDGDGLDDVLIGAPSESIGGWGAVYLVQGDGAAWVSGLLGDADARLGGDGVGGGLGGGGDVDGDGLDDVVLTANPASDVGTAWLFTSLVDPLWEDDAAGVAQAGYRPGTGTVSVGPPVDLDLDGHADLLIGAPGDDPEGAPTGAAYAVMGDGAPATTTLDGDVLQLLGEGAADEAGSALAGVGDVDGDGWPDLVVGASGRGSGAGTAYLLLGGGL